MKSFSGTGVTLFFRVNGSAPARKGCKKSLSSGRMLFAGFDPRAKARGN
jgi:hypothetical protein